VGFLVRYTRGWALLPARRRDVVGEEVAISARSRCRLRHVNVARSAHTPPSLHCRASRVVRWVLRSVRSGRVQHSRNVSHYRHHAPTAIAAGIPIARTRRGHHPKGPGGRRTLQGPNRRTRSGGPVVEHQEQPVGGTADPAVDKAPVLERDAIEFVHSTTLPMGGTWSERCSARIFSSSAVIGHLFSAGPSESQGSRG
jgi:hypothetical protein